MEGIFVYVLECVLNLASLDKMPNIIFLMRKSSKIWGQSILKVILYT